MRHVRLVQGYAYYLQGLKPEMWDVGHPKFGKPSAIAGRYLGHRSGQRTWHVFEIWIESGGVLTEQGAIIMSQQDLDAVTVTRVSG